MIEKINIKEKEVLFQRYMKEDLVLIQYVNVFNSKTIFEEIKKIEIKLFGKDSTERFYSASTFLLHNNRDIKLATKTFGEPIKTEELGEFGEDLDSSYMFFLRVNKKIVMFFIDDRGANFEIEENLSEQDFLQIYESVLVYLKDQFKDIYNIYLKMIKNA